MTDRPGSDGSGMLLFIPQSSKTEALPSDANLCHIQDKVILQDIQSRTKH